MPELPEVQTTIYGLIQTNIIGKTILDVSLDFPKMIKPFSENKFREILIDKSVKNIFRKGKYIFFELDHNWYLVIHLRMSGKFLKDESFQLKKHEHLSIHFSNNIILKFHDPRKFGKVNLTQNIDQILSRIGLDILDSKFTADWFEGNIITKRKSLKSLLLDQSFVSGIGNIYADEILYESQLNPKISAHLLNKKKIQNLYYSIKKVINEAVKNKGTSLGHGQGNFKSFNDLGTHQKHLKVYGKNNQACLRCKKKIIKLKICQRGTYICPKCQPDYI